MCSLKQAGGPDGPGPLHPARSLSIGPLGRGNPNEVHAPIPRTRSDLDLSSYRSFEPILRLLPQGISPVSQHWATWALYNLVSVYREYPLALRSDTGTVTQRKADLPSESLEHRLGTTRRAGSVSVPRGTALCPPAFVGRAAVAGACPMAGAGLQAGWPIQSSQTAFLMPPASK